jgi:hypothetical protein
MKKLLMILAATLSLAATAGQNGGTLSKHPDVLWVDPVTLAMVTGASDFYLIDLMNRLNITRFEAFAVERRAITNPDPIGFSSIHRVWDPITDAIFDSKNPKSTARDNSASGHLRNLLSLVTKRQLDTVNSNVSTWFVPMSNAEIKVVGSVPVRADNGDIYVQGALPYNMCIENGGPDVTVRGREMAAISKYCLAPILTNVCEGVPGDQECGNALWGSSPASAPRQIAIRVTDPTQLGEGALTEGVPMVFGLFVEPTVEINNSRRTQDNATTRARLVKVRGAALVNPVTGKVLCTVRLTLPIKSVHIGQSTYAFVLREVATCKGDM